METLNRYWSCDPLSADDLETEYSLLPDRRKPSGPKPIVGFDGFTVVTAETRKFLEDLNPGPLSFHPITVAKTDLSAPLWDGADLFIMQVLECRRETLIDQSGAINASVSGTCTDGTNRHIFGATDGPDPVVVLPPAEDGAEIWMDDRVKGSIFVSDRIAKAIKDAKWSRAWGLVACRVVSGT